MSHTRCKGQCPSVLTFANEPQHLMQPSEPGHRLEQSDHDPSVRPLSSRHIEQFGD